MNNNDEIREGILKYLYDLSTKALSVNRMKANEVMVIKNLMSRYPREKIIGNLSYLINTGGITQEKIEKIPYYTISDKGVEHFEGASNFQKSHWITGINVTNTQGVIVIGDHNFVHQEYGDLYRSLDVLKNEISKSESIDDQGKLDYQSEIETIKSQLAKKLPNKSIIHQSWLALSTLSTFDGIINFYQIVEPLIKHILK